MSQHSPGLANLPAHSIPDPVRTLGLDEQANSGVAESSTPAVGSNNIRRSRVRSRTKGAAKRGRQGRNSSRIRAAGGEPRGQPGAERYGPPAGSNTDSRPPPTATRARLRRCPLRGRASVSGAVVTSAPLCHGPESHNAARIRGTQLQSGATTHRGVPRACRAGA